MTTTDCTTDYGEYERYSDDRLFHGAGLKIDRSIYYKGDCDISDLITKSVKEAESLRDESIGKENAAYEKVLQAVAEWEKSALATKRHKRALEYLTAPPIEHTSNQWTVDDYDYKVRSNMVYLMRYRIDKRQSRNGTIKWDIELSVKTQSVQWQSAFVLERREKTFSSEESAQKYIDGKIKAYDYLFTEISPVIPDIDKSPFCVNGVLLPGHTTVSMQKQKEKKASIRKQLNELKADKPTKQKQLKTRTKEVSI